MGLKYEPSSEPGTLAIDERGVAAVSCLLDCALADFGRRGEEAHARCPGRLSPGYSLLLSSLELSDTQVHEP